MKKELETINQEIQYIKSVYNNLLKILPSFNITDETILPYGLNPHTRSISWIVEQVITQQTKFNAEKLNLDNVNFKMPDTCLHDCEIEKDGQKFYINIKIHNIDGKKNKNDIAAVEKIYSQYHANKNYRLIYACFGIKFENIKISFDPNYIHCFSPQFMPIYVNPRNDKIQATYHHEIQTRTRAEFLDLLKQNSKSIILE